MSSTSSLQHSKLRKSKAKTLLFAKAAMQYLASIGEFKMREDVKSLLIRCIQKHRSGDTSFRPLSLSISRALQDYLGPLHWADANTYFQVYCRHSHQKRMQKRNQQLHLQEQNQQLLSTKLEPPLHSRSGAVPRIPAPILSPIVPLRLSPLSLLDSELLSACETVSDLLGTARFFPI